jgi:hypothetical protein
VPATVNAGNLRVINIFDNQLYCSGAAAVNAVGSGLPTSSTTITALTGVTPTSCHDYYFADASTLYVTDETNGIGIRKYTLSGATWSQAYQLNSTAGATPFPTNGRTTGICGYRNASGQNVLFVTYYPSSGGTGTLATVTDTGSAAQYTTLATAPTNTTFRGVDFSVLPTNSAPTLTVPANATINEGDAYSASASATDPDSGQTLTSTKVSGPSGLTVNSSTGAIAWTSSESDGGNVFTVTIKVEDNGTPVKSDTKSFTITVNETNQNPTLTDPPDQTVDEGTLDSVTLIGADADLPGQSLTYSKISGPGAVAGNAWSWTPTEADGPGDYVVVVQVSDGSGGTASQSFM